MTPAELAEYGNAHGGFTYSPTGGRLVSQGFAVSCVKGCERTCQALSARDIFIYEVRHRKALSIPGACIGAWFDTASTAQWYLDISTVVPTLDEALALARKHSQLAVYDLTEGRTIALDNPTVML